jgi:hypothetical protein
MWMRGGTSKGGYFLAQDLPTDVAQRDRFLLGVMGSPDKRQIDGMGGADPLTSKVAVVRREVECSPCLKPQCPRGDLICFADIDSLDVAAAARELMKASA